jgi:spore maturation protein CgeB
MKILCAFGQYNYGNIERGESPEYSAFLPALRNLGHEVEHFETWDRRAYYDLADLNAALLEAIQTYRPDLLFTVHMNYEIWLETLAIIKARGDVTTISWATDDSWKYNEVSRFIGPAYDAMITTYDYVVDHYKADGIKNVMVSQWAANSENLRTPLSADQCRYPVSFVGTSHGSRAKWISALRDRGIDVACFGFGWPSGPVSNEEVTRIIRESVISLNFANSQGESQIKARTFEVPGAGGFLLTESAPSLEKFYLPGQEIVIFDGLDDLAAKVEHYLKSPEQRDAIAQAGFKRTMTEHTYEHRLAESLEFAVTSARSRDLRVVQIQFEDALSRSTLTPLLRSIRNVLRFAGVGIYGPKRGPRAARRLVYELSWRLLGRHTFTAGSWPGRMFPHD